MSPCLLCLMSREDVKGMLLSDPRIATRVAEILGRRLISAEQRLSDFAFKNLPERLASLLLQLGRPPKARLFRPAGGAPRCASPTRRSPRWPAPTARQRPRSWARNSPRG